MTRHNVFPTLVLAAALLTAGCSNVCGGAGVGFGVENANAPGLPAPPDVAAAPSDAVRTPSGLASKVLTPGTGTQHPRPNSEVTVHYTGWTTDGTMFDSSVTRGEPATFSLDGVIPGWTEGVQMMVVGEKRRFWIPAKLAYEGVADRPQGTLVFDIELLKLN